MAHHHAEVQEEHYIFKPETKRKLFMLLIAGVVLFALGLFMAISSEGKHEGGDHHAATNSHQLVASVAQDSVASDSVAATDHHATENPSDKSAEHSDAHAAEHAAPAHGGEHHAAGGHHDETPTWKKRLFSTLWHNNVFFAGLGIIGLFFVAIQYAAQAGWSVGVKRVGLALGSWIPFAGILMLGLYFLTHHDIFHWTHSYLYGEKLADGSVNPGHDEIIDGKAPFFFWPLAGGTFPLFFIVRMVVFFGGWYIFFNVIKKNMLKEDLENTTAYWFKIRGISAWFLIFFAVSSSVAAWDWVMSIDTHWFSTMFGWYVFASWWVTGLATITLIVVLLKNAGYLKIVNSNHLHDLGKFCFAFSIFWTYIWFGQFLLIYYANIPEEVTYFMERMRNSPYSWIFYLNLIVNFVLPFLMLMTRDAKRQLSMLRVVCPIIIIGHWFDFFNMVTPGVMKENGVLGLLEIGTALIFAATFLLVVLGALSKMPLFGKHDPMLQESINHHI
ncbi:quinol:cytochrome C oxidoreductase [Pseudochryseolinea flava]|uniref:Quinol:cytochrome C oxidoreductase n=1 Tax=Pseudochryseolinea flava TaxID=2059302 RepID=A0A364XX62_9BACT|nr:quinol:cytochrome C oxidoreductase [Pseudochryseolinea flava]RAV98576.1 quinol:cytochrome C oxidoreductase [Pseudochryseolinea flava]